MTRRARIRGWLRAFRRDRRGVSAVEFALIAPFMLLTYFGLAELTNGLMVQRRVSHAVSAAGDLAAQAERITDDDRDDIFAAARTLVEPFPTDRLKLRITSITGNARGQPIVQWTDGSLPGSAALEPCKKAAGLPAGLITAQGENVIMAEAVYQYTSPVGKVFPNGLTFREKFYLRPRKVAEVPREGDDADTCS